MKIFTTLLLVFIPAGTQSGARGQAVISPAVIPVPLTKLEAFAATTGTLLATETYSLLGIYGEHSCNIRVQVIIMYEIGREAEKVQDCASRSRIRHARTWSLHTLISTNWRICRKPSIRCSI